MSGHNTWISIGYQIWVVRAANRRQSGSDKYGDWEKSE